MRKLPYVHSYRDRHGKRRNYFRKPGAKRIALPGAPGSDEFMAAYQAALAGVELPAREIGAERTKRGTIADLIVRYYNSSEWEQLEESTRAAYRGVLERLRREHGNKPVARLKRKHIKAMIDARAKTPNAANSLLKRIRSLMKIAITEEMITVNPTADIEFIKIKTDGFYSWTEEDIEKFEQRWPVGTRERLALGLLLYSAQRRSDVVKMGRQHIRDGQIMVRQQKTRTSLWIPLHPELARIIAQTPADNLTFLVTSFCKPFTAPGLGNWFRDACNAAGLPQCSAHGLRKAAARRMAEAGCTPHQIQAVTGHKSLQDVALYTKAAEQKKLAKEAMKLVETANSTPDDGAMTGTDGPDSDDMIITFDGFGRRSNDAEVANQWNRLAKHTPKPLKEKG